AAAVDGFLRESAYLPPSTVDALRAVARSADTNLARLLSAAAAILLHRLNGAEDVIVGLPVAARSDVSRHIPGMASNVLPLRLSLGPRSTALEVLAQTVRRIRQSIEHQRYQLPEMRRDLSGGAGSRTLFGLSINVMAFDYGAHFAGHRSRAHNLSLGPVED